jgi:magnesium chelatase subunit D
MSGSAAIWSDAVTAAALFAIDPAASGGVLIRAGAGPVRDRWLEVLRQGLPSGTALRKLPPGISDGRLLGGIDLAATLQAGHAVLERGLLAEVGGGVLLAVMAERLAPSTVAHLNAVIDSGEIMLERDGVSLRLPSSFGVVALDEGIDEERAPVSLCDRLAFHLDLRSLSYADLVDLPFDADASLAARGRLNRVTIPDEAIETLCHAAASLGISSLRAVLLASRVARAAAALDDEKGVGRAQLELAARLVLAPRATVLPAPADSEPEPDPPDQEETGQHEQEDISQADDRPLDDLVLEAAQAAIPPDLLKRLQDGGAGRQRHPSSGKQGLSKLGPRRGRPIGARRGELRAGARLNVLETLRAAAPWQPLRRRTQPDDGDPTRLLIRKDDFRITRFKQKSGTTTIFVVDASGSSALQRLAEVKGAVELLLADCYIRRDEVALISFRGSSAELLLPPTRSLTRAKRSLAALPGGGGTPLSTAIVAAMELALAVRAKDLAPTIVLLTDGRANVSRDGSGGRAAAEAEALEAARQLAATAIPVVVVDTSPRSQPQAENLATAMRARYVALPYADADRLSRAVQANIRPG